MEVSCRHVGFGRGVALLMTLSMIVLISVALMKMFEKRSVEVAHLGHNLDRFQAETLSRSVFRAILIAIRQQGLVAIIGNQALWQDVPFPLENGTFRIESIKPADQRHNLNARITSVNAIERRERFYNVVSRIRREHAPELYGIFQEEVSPSLSAIIDFVDPDREPDPVFLYDFEYYPHAQPPFTVKNRELERVGEIRLLEPIRKLGIAQAPLEDYFRVHGDLIVPEFIDINLAQPGEVTAFLELFQNVPGYENAYHNREALDDIATDTDYTQMETPTGLLNVEPRFPPDNFYHRIDSRWLGRLTNRGITLEPKEQELFRPVTYLLEVRFSVAVGRVMVRVISLLQLSYLDDRKSLAINQIRILTFAMT
jgi:hypothetical protein